MKAVKSLLRNINEKKSYKIVFFIVSMSIIFGAYFLLHYMIKRDKEWVVEDDNFVGYVENIKVEEEKLSISGWCFYKDIESSCNLIEVYLRNTANENDVVQMDTSRTTRPDVNKYYKSKTDYGESGYIASKSLKDINLEENTYEIFVKMRFEESVSESIEEVVKIIPTGRYIDNGNLVACLTREKLKPVKTNSKELEEVFNRGILLTYREERDIYLYQYNKKLYWVAGERFGFDEDGLTFIEVCAYIMKDNTLSGKSELTAEWISFNFEEKEIMDNNTAPYRVAVQSIPIEYPVAYIFAGESDGYSWKWVGRVDINVEEILK